MIDHAAMMGRLRAERRRRVEVTDDVDGGHSAADDLHISRQSSRLGRRDAAVVEQIVDLLLSLLKFVNLFRESLDGASRID